MALPSLKLTHFRVGQELQPDLLCQNKLSSVQSDERLFRKIGQKGEKERCSPVRVLYGNGSRPKKPA
jgi:hypothetical protein